MPAAIVLKVINIFSLCTHNTHIHDGTHAHSYYATRHISKVNKIYCIAVNVTNTNGLAQYNTNTNTYLKEKNSADTQCRNIQRQKVETKDEKEEEGEIKTETQITKRC